MLSRRELVDGYRYNSTPLNASLLLDPHAEDRGDPGICLSKAMARKVVEKFGLERSWRAIKCVIALIHAQEQNLSITPSAKSPAEIAAEVDTTPETKLRRPHSTTAAWICSAVALAGESLNVGTKKERYARLRKIISRNEQALTERFGLPRQPNGKKLEWSGKTFDRFFKASPDL